MRRISIHEFAIKVHGCPADIGLCDFCRTEEKMAQIDLVYCELLSLPCLR